MVVALNLLSRALLWPPRSKISRCEQNPFNRWRRNHGAHWLPEGVHARPNPDQGPRPDPGTLVGHQTGNNAAAANKTFSNNTNTLNETGRAAADWFSIWKFLIKSNGGQWTSLIDSYDNFKQFPTDLRNDDRPRCSDLQQRGYVRLIIPSFEHLWVLLLFGEAF